MDRNRLEQAIAAKEQLLERRGPDPLFLWTPTKKQKPFIESVLLNKKPINGFIASNRCLTPFTPVEMGSATRLPVEVIGEAGFDVQSWDGESRCTKSASPLFLKGIEPAFRIHLDNGQAFETSGKHRVLTIFGWASLDYLLSIQDDPRLTEKYADYLASCGMDGRLYGQRPHLEEGSDKEAPRTSSGVRPRSRKAFEHWDVAEPTQEHSLLRS